MWLLVEEDRVKDDHARWSHKSEILASRMQLSNLLQCQHLSTFFTRVGMLIHKPGSPHLDPTSFGKLKPGLCSDLQERGMFCRR